jgi:hypothetical protein
VYRVLLIPAFAILLAALPALAAETDEDEDGVRAAAKAGGGIDKPALAAQLRPLLARRFGIGPDSVACRCLAAAVADKTGARLYAGSPRPAGFPDGVTDMALQRAGEAFDSFKPILPVLDRLNVPDAFRAVLHRYYGDLLLWPLRQDPPALDADQEVRRLETLSGGTAFLLRPDESLWSRIAGDPAYRALAALPPVRKWLLYRHLDAVNPCLRWNGSFAATTAETERRLNPRLGPDIARAPLDGRLFAIDPSLKPEGYDASEGHPEYLVVPVGGGLNQVICYRLSPPYWSVAPPPAVALELSRPRDVDVRGLWLRDARLLDGLDPDALDARGTLISDAAPIAGMRSLKKLRISSSRVSDLAPLRGLKLEFLEVEDTAVSSLVALADMPLKHLNLGRTRVTDLSPLAGMPLEHLEIHNSPVRDLSPVASLPLRYLRLQMDADYASLEPVLGHPTLTHVSDTPKATWIRENRQLLGRPVPAAALRESESRRATAGPDVCLDGLGAD